MNEPKPSIQVSFNLNDHRDDPAARSWTLPTWGHPLAQGVMPLFLAAQGMIRPIGTCFSLGGKVRFFVSALHCIELAIREDPLLSRRAELGLPIGGATLKAADLYALYAMPLSGGGVKRVFMPVENISGALPSDIVIMHTVFDTEHPIFAPTLSFDLPEPGYPIHSLGYDGFQFPVGGIPIDGLASFSWERDYHHDFRVVEGEVSAVFTHGFAAGYGNGPMFAFDNEITSGMSGGPILDTSRNVIVGMNSATVTSFFGQPMSLGTLFLPLVPQPMKFGANIFGDPRFRINSTQPVIDMIEFGSIAADNTHEKIVYQRGPEGISLGYPVHDGYEDKTFESFDGYQRGIRPRSLAGNYFVRVRKSTGDR